MTMQAENELETILHLIRVIDKAIMSERNAVAFYHHAARKVSSVEGKKMFEWLADFEAAHELRLLTGRKDLFADPAMEGYHHFPVEDDHTAAEIHSSAISPEISEQQILMIALENEQEAATYYQASADTSPNPVIKHTFERMAREEERHIRILSEQIKHLEVEQFWMDWAAFDDSKKRPGE
jgi:rubrerythrin